MENLTAENQASMFELTPEVISCWMTIQRFGSLFDLPELTLKDFERMISTVHASTLLVQLHMKLLKRLYDTKQVVRPSDIELNEVTWAQHLGLVIRNAEQIAPSLTAVERQCQILDQVLRYIYPNRLKKPEYHVGQALGDLVAVSDELALNQPLDEEDFQERVLKVLGPVDHRDQHTGESPTSFFLKQCELTLAQPQSNSYLLAAIEAVLNKEYNEVPARHRVTVLSWLCAEICNLSEVRTVLEHAMPATYAAEKAILNRSEKAAEEELKLARREEAEVRHFSFPAISVSSLIMRAADRSSSP